MVSRYRLVIVGCAVCASLFLVLKGCTSYSVQGQANALQVKKVGSAIKQYSAAKGRCPISLDELVPNYLPAIPELGGDVRWLYAGRQDNRSFSLAAAGDWANWTIVYIDDTDDIIIDDK